MKVPEFTQKLRQLTTVNIQNNWFTNSEEVKTNIIDFTDLDLMVVDKKEFLTWNAGSQTKWLIQEIIIQESLNGYCLKGFSLRLSLTWWAEKVQIFVNKKLVQVGDLFDSSARILLTSSVKKERKIVVSLCLTSPSHDIGALMKSQLIYEKNHHLIDPGFLADEIDILYKYLYTFKPNKVNFLEKQINRFDWTSINNSEHFNNQIYQMRWKLMSLSNDIKKRNFNILGHAHLDMAWLWTINETWEIGKRTFQSVINLQNDFKDLTFCHTSPALYEWIEKKQPDLFQEIMTQSRKNKWEVLGGMWIEPEVNLVSGESLVRQVLYGQRYIKEKFGETTKVAWLPDSFGFCLQLPQIFKLSEIDYFVTGKLHWGRSVKFPHSIFWWKSLDGTKILTLMSPPNTEGVVNTKPGTMTDYSVQWEKETQLKEIFWIPGIGDHGGGPTRDMLKVVNRWSRSPFFPNITFTTAKKYLDKVFNIIKNELNIPTWDDELYLDLHRGCYTTHADQKYFNRRTEELLYKAELWVSISSIIDNKSVSENTRNSIQSAWKQTLLNQFHDILPGTSTSDVFIEANKGWKKTKSIAEKVLNKALRKIVSYIEYPPAPHIFAKPIVIFNHLNWERSEVIELDTQGDKYEVFDLNHNKLCIQMSHSNKLLFCADNIPSIGYKIFWIIPFDKVTYTKTKVTEEKDCNFILENSFLMVEISRETGNIATIYDKVNHCNVLKTEGNQLESFQDKGQYWDAWNIDPEYNKYPLPNATLKFIEVLEKGPIQWKIRVIKKIGQSQFIQDYILQINSSILEIETTVDWKETYVLVKASFHFSIRGDYTSYEIPFGSIKRTNLSKTSYEKSKWEVPSLRWADITDNNNSYGVSLLNDCKYGYDSRNDLLRLTLLKSPRWPDSNCDKGIHQFSYAIYPHKGTTKEAKTIHKAHEFNMPLQVIRINSQYKCRAKLPPVFSGISINNDNLILSAFKPSEDKKYNYILRCYESEGEETNIDFRSDLELRLDKKVNLLEQEVDQNKYLVKPWEIISFMLIDKNLCN
ncbi:MAG: alpha-mannosidase [Candidatus Atelocyanobacterium thalassa]